MKTILTHINYYKINTKLVIKIYIMGPSQISVGRMNDFGKKCVGRCFVPKDEILPPRFS